MTRQRIEVLLVLAGLTAISFSSVALVNHFGWTLYYGDAEAHLNIARRIVDSRTPGYDQIGTVWLPLPHVLMLLLVWKDDWWQNGMAGAIPSAIYFIGAGAFLFAAMRSATKSSAAALASLGLFALNPNLLYLQATPMTEPLSLACLMALLYFNVRFRETQSLRTAALAGLAALAASLTRYEGWFVMPFAALYFLIAARHRRFLNAAVFVLIAGLGPLYWFAHNWWVYDNPLEFFNGPYSAMSISARDIAQHIRPYPGDHNWRKAWLFFRTAALLCGGSGAFILGSIGILAALWKRVFWPLFFAGFLPVFYLWSMHSGGTPIHLPQLWFNSYYNTRYGLAALPLIAVAGGCLTLATPARFARFVALAIVFAGLAPWLADPHPEAWICWKESKVNSEARRAWTREAARFFTTQYELGQGIFVSFGDLTGIFQQARIPLRETLHQGNVLAWISATSRPDLFLHQRWAVAIPGDEVAATVERAASHNGPRYHLVRTILVSGAPPVLIFRQGP